MLILKKSLFSLVTSTAMLTPTNLIGYRKNFTFSLTGSILGEVWGTSIYTDDSDLATAPIHAGVVQNLVTKVISVKILSGQSIYRGSTRNEVTTTSYFVRWNGSYSLV